jgi:hypothetical protein
MVLHYEKGGMILPSKGKYLRTNIEKVSHHPGKARTLRKNGDDLETIDERAKEFRYNCYHHF